MKYSYFPALALLFPLAAQAQQSTYWPLLRPGLTYQVSQAGTPGDTAHTVRLGRPALLATADSGYTFNQQVVGLRPGTSGNCYRTHASRPNRLFGGTVTVSNTERGRYVMQSGTSALTLRLRQPIGASWAAAPGLTASVTARSAAIVFGQPDSVVTITLSNSQTIRIGKRVGWMEGPAPADVLRGATTPRRLTLTAIPELNLGTPALGDWAVFDFLPNDVFLRYYKQETWQGAICEESWTRDSVLTRTLSPDGNTLTYSIWRQTLTRRFGSPGAPMGFCNNTPGTILSPATTYTKQVSRLSSGEAQLLSSTAGAVTGNGPAWIASTSYRTGNYFGRKLQSQLQRFGCTSAPADSVWLGILPDVGGSRSYAAGLGLVAASSFEYTGTSTTTLLGYRKMTVSTGMPETWGSLRTFAQILSARDKQPQATTAAFPNPFVQELTLRFEAARAQQATIRLYDALGRLALQTTRPVAAGAAELKLSTATLPAGVYALHLLREGRTEVLKVVKTE